MSAAGFEEKKRQLSGAKQQLLEKLLKSATVIASSSPMIRRGPKQPFYPLSFAQQRLWFLNQVEPDAALYSVIRAFRLRGPLDIAALKESLAVLISRHASLRTTFDLYNNEPVQIVTDEMAVPFSELDLSRMASATREVALAEFLREESRRPFDLGKGPLVRFTHMRLDDQEHMLTVAMHHTVTDDWSMGIFFRELSTLYNGFSSGQRPALPEIPIQYTDFAIWQRNSLSRGEFSAQLAYWKEKLAGSSPNLNLPAKQARSAKQSPRGAKLSLPISRELVEKLRMLGEAEGCTLFVVLLAVFEVLLARYTGEEDVVVGTVISDRDRRELESLVGFLTNTVVLRATVSADYSFKQVLRQVRGLVPEAHKNKDIPFEHLVRELRPDRINIHAPLFQVSFTLQNAYEGFLSLNDTQVEPVAVDNGTAIFDLSFVPEQSAEGLNITLQYNTELFEESTIRRMAEHYQRLVDRFITNPDQRVSEVCLLTGQERQQVLNDWNATLREYPRGKTIHELFQQQVQRTPEAVAVIDEHQELSYQELNRRANRLANYLKSLAVGPDVLVGICLERSAEMIVSLLAAMKAGGAYVPLDPASPPERLGYLIDQSGMTVAITQEELASSLGLRIKHKVCLDAATERQMIEAQNEENLSGAASGKQLAYMICTSGSTGMPKGVMIEHESVLNLTEALGATIYNDPVFDRQRISLNGPLAFDTSVKQIIQLLSGHTLCIVPESARLDPAAFAEFSCRTAIDVLDCTPTQLAALLASGEFAGSGRMPRTVLVGGEAVHPKLWSQLLKLQETTFYNLYGPTECSVDSTVCRIAPPQAVPRIGQPVANTQAYILDPRLEPMPVGVVGELYIGGAGLARGYLGRPDLTAERFVPDPFGKPGGRLYRTGDLARWQADATIEFLGRVDHQVKVRGYRIEMEEIEAVLGQHEQVQQCAVRTYEDERGEKRLIGYMVVKAEPAPTSHDLRGFLREKLPDYMVPSAFVALPGLPVGANGKVDRQALPVSEAYQLSRDERQVYPRDGTELYLKAIWEEVLGTADIGINDDFFELGGHSLMAIILAAQIGNAYQTRLSVRTIFENPTIAALSAFIRQTITFAPPSSVIPIQPRGARRPFFCAHSGGGLVNCYMALARHLGPDRPFYGLQSHGLDEGQEPVTRIEDMAALYIRDLRKIQAGGPYQIGGWCLGATVAYEMAQQLTDMGETISLLAIFDEMPGSHPIEHPLTRDDVDAAEKERIKDMLAGKGISAEVLAALAFDQQLELLLQKYKASGNIPSDVALAQCRRFLRVWVTNDEARKRYHYRPFAGRVTLFRSNLSGSNERMSRWQALALGGLDEYQFPVAHDQFVDETNAQSLAEALSQCMDNDPCSEPLATVSSAS
jgi:amino acid adenylation domain-containing protein